MQEALRIDGTRADTLATYALFLAEHAPEAKKQAKAEKYFEMALQASPYDAALQQRYRVFKGEEDPEPEPTTTVRRGLTTTPRHNTQNGYSHDTRHLTTGASAPSGPEEFVAAVFPPHERRAAHVRVRPDRCVDAALGGASGAQAAHPHSRLRAQTGRHGHVRRPTHTTQALRSTESNPTQPIPINRHCRNGFSDPYCVVTHGSQTHQTETKKKTLNPAWNETFNMYVTHDAVQSLFSFIIIIIISLLAHSHWPASRAVWWRVESRFESPCGTGTASPRTVRFAPSLAVQQVPWACKLNAPCMHTHRLHWRAGDRHRRAAA